MKFQQKEDLRITSEKLYLSRRKFIRNIAIISCGTVLAASCTAHSEMMSSADQSMGTSLPVSADQVNTFEEISSYTNFYEFAEDKSSPNKLAKNLKTSPWFLTIDGLVNKPATILVDELKKSIPSEERIYRMRCVEGWSMVIPWRGFPLQRLIHQVEPTNEAKFVRFTALMDPSQFPNQNRLSYPWPYTEGLRLDEANNDLTFLATGLYGKDLPPQNGSPIRLVVPWKYGFKSIKSIVRIELVSEQPQTFWSRLWPEAYGFYANVNPDVSHPRWSQATEMRIGENKRRKTLLFNGYQDQVAGLYQGMDLITNH